MGFHVSPKPETGFIHGGDESVYHHMSTGDSILTFSSGRKWQFPDALAYYIYDCGYQPPEDFIRDVMESSLTDAERCQTKSIVPEAVPVSVLPCSKNAERTVAIGYLNQQKVNEAALSSWVPSVAGRDEFLNRLFAIWPTLYKHAAKDERESAATPAFCPS